MFLNLFSWLWPFGNTGTVYTNPIPSVNPTPPAANEMLYDGNFETSGVALNGYGEYTTIGGWKTSTAIEAWGRAFKSDNISSDGNAHIEIDSGNTAGNNLYQLIQTQAGKSYTLSFDFAQRAGTTAATNAFEVLVNGKVVQLITPSSTTWAKASFLVTGTGGLDKIEFRELASDTDGVGGLLDNVSFRPFQAAFGGASNADAQNIIHLAGETSDFLLNAANTPGALRNVDGFGNNVEHPLWGNADQPFIRLTPAHYGDTGSNPRGVVNGVQTLANERIISNVIVSQDDNRDGVEDVQNNDFGTNLFLMSFGQFFDHGLDFVKRGTERYSVTTETGSIISLTRGEQDANGNHINKTSPFIDQNQTYGSDDAITYYLRKSFGVDANGNGTVGGKSANLLSSAADASGHEGLPTYRDILLNNGVSAATINAAIAANSFAMLAADADFVDFRNVKDPATGLPSGHPLLLDINANANPSLAGVPGINFSLDLLLNHIVGGDGRVNENIALTPIHTIWHREHDFQVDKLRSLHPEWTEEQLFQSAKIIVEMEYQHIVFGEFADDLVGGIPGPDHYNPNVNATISEEFAHAVYRVGHSMINETIPFTDSEGKIVQMSLVQAFLNPQAFKDIGVDSLIDGSTRVLHQRIDENIVNAVRNQLLGERLNDLGAINIARGRETGLPSLNEMRKYLYENGMLNSGEASELGQTAQGNSQLKPYATWAEFAANLRDPSLVEQFKQVYGSNDADVNKVDIWVGGLAEKPTAGQLGSTFGFIFREQLARLREGDRFYYTERLDDTQLLDDIESQSFADIIMRNSGLNYLNDDIFKVAKQVMMSGTELTKTGGASSEVIVGNALANTISGGAGDDTIYGNAGDDYLHGNDGGDALRGGDGNDTERGGNGNDRVIGGAGNDWLYGELGDDAVFGDDGDDTMSGDAGFDELRGGAGNDVGYGGADDDEMSGGAGNDRLYGELGNDRISGGAGDDIIDGGEGDDRLSGGAGNDQIIGGSGLDTADFETAKAGVTVNLATQTASGAATGADTMSSIEYIKGSAFDDVLTGDYQANVISGDAGNDTVSGGDGNDRLDGEKGNDKLIGGAGNDYMDGGLGNDTADYSAATAGITANLVSGTVTGAATGVDSLYGFERIDGSAYADTLTGGIKADILMGGAGNDTISGADGNDVINGGLGNDNLDGGAGDDAISTGSGNDTLTGGDGNDTLDGGTGSDVINGGNGVDKVSYAFASSGVTINLAAGSASGANAGIDYLGGIEIVVGSNYADTITGSTNAETLQGGGGDDTIRTGGGNDVVDGGDGNDMVEGGAGADMLTGGAGADRFVANTAADIGLAMGATDIITDFAAGVDKIDLTKIDANTLLAGTQGFSWLGTAAMTRIAGQLNMEQADNAGTADDYTLLRGDVNGDGVADFSLRLNGLVNLGLGDIAGATLAPPPVITGTAGVDVLVGTANADVIEGLGSADTLTGGAAADRFVFKAVSDIGLAAGQTDVITDFTAGVDKIDLSGIDANALLAGQQGFTFIGAGLMDATPGQLRYVQYDNAGTDNDYTLLRGDVNGDKAADFSLRLNGLVNLTLADIIGASAPVVTPPPSGTTGTAGVDVLVGTANADVIEGLGAADTLTGGAGADRFVFKAASDIGLTYGQTDVITDFLAGTDKIDLSGIDANAVAAGDQAFTFIGNGLMAATPGQLRYVQYDNVGTADDYTLVRGDVHGDQAADFSLKLTGLVTLTAADFVL